MNWRIVAIPASVVPFVILLLTANVSVEDIFKVGLIPFIASAAAAIARMIVQAIRFKYFIRRFIGYDVASTGKTIAARLAGEFVTQTSPSYVGGEFVRIAWLSRNGVPPGKAAWVATMEIIADVFVGCMLAFIAGGLAIYKGGSVVGIIVILFTIPTFSVWLAFILFSAKRILKLPSFSERLLEKFIAKEKAERLINSTNLAIADLCKMSRENFNSSAAIKTFAVGIVLTFVAFLFYGVSFMVLANAVESSIGLFDSLMATSASQAIANLPVTIGGSGLAEFGIWAYISNLSGIPDLATIAKDSQLSVIIAWRIATYHVPLVITWIALMKLTIGKVSSSSPAAAVADMQKKQQPPSSVVGNGSSLPSPSSSAIGNQRDNSSGGTSEDQPRTKQ